MLILSAINPEQALSDDEAELMELDLAAVAAGSTEALERLYNTAKAAVYSYSLSVLRNVQDAEDVLHDCFVNIFTAAAGYRPHGKPMAWIITIAKNLCFARLRQYNRQEQLPDEDWSEMLADNAGLSNEDRLVCGNASAGFPKRRTGSLFFTPWQGSSTGRLLPLRECRLQPFFQNIAGQSRSSAKTFNNKGEKQP